MRNMACWLNGRLFQSTAPRRRRIERDDHARRTKVESDEIVAAAKANGVPAGYIVFDDEGHGFVKKSNQIRGYRATLEFLERHLK